MAHDRRAAFGFAPEKLLEKYCPVCGELRPVRTERDDDGTKRYFAPNAKLRSARKSSTVLKNPSRPFPMRNANCHP